MKSPQKNFWLLNGYPQYLKEKKKKNSPDSVRAYIGLHYGEKTLCELISQLFWETHTLRKGVTLAIGAIEAIANEDIRHE